MERGGFHGYRKPPQTISSGMQPPERTETTTTTTNHNHHMITDLGIECTVREQDRFMPIANVIRIMRKILPPHAKVSDDSKETIQECVSEFISFVTSEANDRCQREQRKTITAEDILWGMSKLGFDDYIEPLTLYLNRYRESEGDNRVSIRSEPFVKRSAFDLGASSSSSSGTRFAPVFDLGPNPYGYFGSVVAVGEFVMNDGSNGGSSSQAGVTSNEPYANCNK